MTEIKGRIENWVTQSLCSRPYGTCGGGKSTLGWEGYFTTATVPEDSNYRGFTVKFPRCRASLTMDLDTAQFYVEAMGGPPEKYMAYATKEDGSRVLMNFGEPFVCSSWDNDICICLSRPFDGFESGMFARVNIPDGKVDILTDIKDENSVVSKYTITLSHSIQPLSS
jgi:hypothetical protein